MSQSRRSFLLAVIVGSAVALSAASFVIGDRASDRDKGASEALVHPPEPTPSSPAPDTIVNRCETEPTQEAADIDGDGKLDVIYQAGGNPAFDARDKDVSWAIRLGVCATLGIQDEIPVGGMGEVFRIVDIEPDGRSEIIAGGTSVSASFSEFYALKDNALTPISLNGNAVTLVEGFGNNELLDWGCSDLHGDATRELVQVSATWPVNDEAGSWRKEVSLSKEPTRDVSARSPALLEQSLTRLAGVASWPPWPPDLPSVTERCSNHGHPAPRPRLVRTSLSVGAVVFLVATWFFIE